MTFTTWIICCNFVGEDTQAWRGKEICPRHTAGKWERQNANAGRLGVLVTNGLCWDMSKAQQSTEHIQNLWRSLRLYSGSLQPLAEELLFSPDYWQLCVCWCTSIPNHGRASCPISETGSPGLPKAARTKHKSMAGWSPQKPPLLKGWFGQTLPSPCPLPQPPAVEVPACLPRNHTTWVRIQTLRGRLASVRKRRCLFSASDISTFSLWEQKTEITSRGRMPSIPGKHLPTINRGF